MNKRVVNRIFKNITKKSKKLLCKSESYDVDFKKTVKSISTEDLVAFSNSPEGGTILVGVEEIKDKKGNQKGKIVGCSTGDKDKLVILNKARSCRSPIDLEIFIENINSQPFFRVEIPSGENKPYCTENGTYTIRGDGQNKPLTPDYLLDMYMDIQSSKFINKFRQATAELDQKIGETKKNLLEINNNVNTLKEKFKEDIDCLLSEVTNMSDETIEMLERMFSSAESAEESSGEAMGFSDEILGTINELEKKIDNIGGDSYSIHKKIDALLKHFNIEDPYIAERRKLVREFTIQFFDKNYDAENIFQGISKSIGGVEEEIIRKWINETIKELKNKD